MYIFLYAPDIDGQIDIYSQYYFFKSIQTPAETGLFERRWRVFAGRRYEFHDSKQFHARNQTIAPEIKIPLMKKAGEYGLYMKEYSGNTIGLGIVDYRVHHNNEQDYFRADFFSLALHHQFKRKREGRKHQLNYLSFGMQPGYIRMYHLRAFDVNAGLMFSREQIECWTEDQYFRTQIGVSGYHLLSDFRRNDTAYYPGRRLHLHYGQLINTYRHLYFFVNAQTIYDSKFDVLAGVNVLFFPEVHYKFYDRGRLGLHYRSSNHLVLSGGFRLYGAGERTISLDLSGSIEIGMGFLDLTPRYPTAIEIGMVLTPLHKCWPLKRC